MSHQTIGSGMTTTHAVLVLMHVVLLRVRLFVDVVHSHVIIVLNAYIL